MHCAFCGHKLTDDARFCAKCGGKARESSPSPLTQIEELNDEWELGCVLDVETTGLSRKEDEVVELALVLFAFESSTRRPQGIVGQYCGLREPGKPIPKEAERVHGISNSMVKGKLLDNGAVISLISRAQLFIAHNAAFDIGFASPLYPQLAAKDWYCSMNGIDWFRHGYTSRALQSLLRAHHLEIGNAHRALDDAQGLLLLLSQPTKSGVTYLAELTDAEKNADHSAVSLSRARSAKNSNKAMVALPSPKQRGVFSERWYLDAKAYLEFCRNSQGAAIDVARSAPLNWKRYDSASLVTEKAEKFNELAKISNNPEDEVRYLLQAVAADCVSPWPYERLAIEYAKRRDYQKAYDACETYFCTEHWLAPNWGNSSLRLFERLQKLEKRIK